MGVTGITLEGADTPLEPGGGGGGGAPVTGVVGPGAGPTGLVVAGGLGGLLVVAKLTAGLGVVVTWRASWAWRAGKSWGPA